jgi:branched-chain amino acid transport system ATP-binding protein
VTDEASVLAVSDLSVGYGPGHTALSRISFTLSAGRTLAVLGPNGAGKSTLGRALCGLIPARAGTIHLKDEDITHVPAHKVAAKGLTYIPEGRGIFRTLTVEENLRLGAGAAPSGNRNQMFSDAYSLFPVLKARRRQRAGTLSGGEQQMLALSRALCIGARVIVADEVSLGLAPRIVEEVFDVLRTAAQGGATLIVIEQFVDQVLAFADEALILRRGELAWSGPAAQAYAAAEQHYLGTTATDR